jgi:GT2 family glycosyltransferase
MAAAEIINVDVADPPLNLSIAEEQALIVFWWRDYPVGQEWIRGAKRRLIEVKPLVDRIVDSDVVRVAEAATEHAAEASDARIPTTASLVICTRNRPQELARCLKSLADQTAMPAEVIVVDNASTDARAREVTIAAGFTYVQEDRLGLDFARNAGVSAATGEIILFTDDDVRLHPRWLERMVEAFDGPDIEAVTGLVLPAELETEAQWFFEKYWGFGRGFRRKGFDEAFFKGDRFHGCPTWEIGAGASMAFRRKVFDRAGLFDPRLDVGQAGCSGDSEYWHRVLSHGGKCRYEPSAVAFHFHRRDMSQLSNQIFYYMRGHAAALMVQFERSGNWGNLRRALLSMPWWYAQRITRGLLRGWSPEDRFIGREIAGFVSGLGFYLRQPRPRHDDRDLDREVLIKSNARR